MPVNTFGKGRGYQDPNYRFDIEEAKNVLKRAGFNLSNLPPLKITATTHAISRIKSEFFVRSFARIDWKVKLKTVSWVELIKKTKNGDYQVYYAGESYDYINLLNFLGKYYSGNIGTENASNLRSDEIFYLFNQLKKSPINWCS